MKAVSILRNIAYSNLVVSLAAGMLSAGFVAMTCNSEINKALFYGLFSFGSTLAVYNFQRFVKVNQGMATDWKSWVKRHLAVVLFLIFSGLFISGFSLFSIFQMNSPALLYLSIAIIISIFYVVRIKDRNLRSIPYLKIYLIALVWVVVTMFIPLINEQQINSDTLYFSLIHIIYFVAVTIPFDIRDLPYDDSEQKTIPQMIGEKNAVFVSGILLFVFYVLALVLMGNLVTNPLFHTTVSIQMIFLVKMHIKRDELYTTILIDGSIILLGLAYFFG